MNDKKLYLHAGGSKSGSSAIQAFLSLNSKRLQQLGFCYREFGAGVSNQYQITSGNGVELFSETTLANARPAERRTKIRQRLLAHFDDQSANAICSAEHFTLLTYEQWSELLEIAAEERIQVVVCYYVRDLLGFLSSSYDQGLKRHGYSVSWIEFVSKVAVWEHFQALTRLAKACDPNYLRVLSYDVCKGRLLESFLDVLGVANSFDPVELARVTSQIVNRSLTSSERHILRTLNAATSDQYSMQLSDLLLQARPDAQPDPLDLDEAGIQRLSAAFGDQVAWINETFFGGETVVKLRPSVVRVTRTDAHEFKDGGESFRLAFEFLSQALASEYTNATSHLASKLLTIDWENAGNPALPDDFDPLGYLLCNPDLLLSQVKPFRHYLEFGWQEARTWKVQVLVQEAPRTA